VAEKVRPPNRVCGIEPVRSRYPKDGERGKPTQRPPQPPMKPSPETEPPDEAHQVDVEV